MPSGWRGTIGRAGGPGGRRGSTSSWSSAASGRTDRGRRGSKEEEMADGTVAALRREVVDELKRRFVGRDEVIELIALAVVAGEHLFLHGPPGTAKSALLRQVATAVRGRYI